MLDQFLAWAVVILPTVFALGIEIVSKEIKEHRYWRAGVLVFGVGLSTLTWYQMSRATRAANLEREQAIVATSEKVSARVSESVSKSVTKAVVDQYTGTINTLQGQIGSLQSQLATQGKNVEAIKGSNIVTGKGPIKVELSNPGILNSAGAQPLDIHISAMWATPVPQLGKRAKQFIMTTNKVMNGGHVVITCRNKINDGNAVISGGNVLIGGGGGMIAENAFQSGIASPNWSPDSPLVVTLYFDEDDLGPCTVKPLS